MELANVELAKVGLAKEQPVEVQPARVETVQSRARPLDILVCWQGDQRHLRSTETRTKPLRRSQRKQGRDLLHANSRAETGQTCTIPGNIITPHDFIATFRVARLTLQTRKLWLVGWLVGWSVWRPTVTRITFELPECKQPSKNGKKRKQKKERGKMEKKN